MRGSFLGRKKIGFRVLEHKGAVCPVDRDLGEGQLIH